MGAAADGIHEIFTKKISSHVFCEKPMTAETVKILSHTMVLPSDHVPDMNKLTDEELPDFSKTTRLCLHYLESSEMPEGFNVGINFGKVAGAGLGVQGHLHIVPRWAGDAAFIAVAGETRVIPEHISRTYNMLPDVFRNRSLL